MSDRNPTTRAEPRSIGPETQHGRRPLDEFFLAARGLTNRRTENLLLSSSFGANSVLYAAVLGYAIGAWALVIQVFWTMSFFLLARRASDVQAATSLHEFLEFRFTAATRKVAALCSAIGTLYFAGWEIATARSSIGALSIVEGSASGWRATAAVLCVALVAIAAIYTMAWGQRGNGPIDVALNFLKVATLVALVALVIYGVATSGGGLKSAILPSFSSAWKSLGWIALVTNLVFNILWQFVDNSTWQTISSNAKTGQNTASSIRRAGIWTLVTVNGLSTLLGAALRNDPLISANSLLGAGVASAGHLKVLALTALLILLTISAMSLIDGLMLSAAQSLLVDLRSTWKLPRVPTLIQVRVTIAILALLVAVGVESIISAFGGSIFDFVYVFIVAQLSLTGPAVVGLLHRGSDRKPPPMWIAIVMALAVGTAAAGLGTVDKSPNWVEAAGAISAGVSLCAACALTFVAHLWRAGESWPDA